MGGKAKPSDFFPRSQRRYEEDQETKTRMLAEKMRAAFSQHNANIARKQAEATTGSQ